MIGPLRPQTDAGPVVEPEPPALRLFTGNLQPLPPPDPLDTLEVHHPACRAQQRRDPAIAVTAILHGKRNDVGGQSRFVIAWSSGSCAASSDAGREPGRQSARTHRAWHHMLDAGTTTGGAYKFPEAASFRILA